MCDKYKCQMQMQHTCTYNDKYLKMYRMRMRWEYEQLLKIFQVLRMKLYILIAWSLFYTS